MLVRTENLIKLDGYFKIEPNSVAKQVWDSHWENRTAAWQALKKEVAEVTGLASPTVAVCGEFFSGICIDDKNQVPDDFRLANAKEPQQCEGKWFIYPNGKTKRGKILKKALDPNNLTRLPGTDDLVTKLGFGYGKRLFTIGNRFYHGCGYKEEEGVIKIQACLFKSADGKFYHVETDKLVSKLPLVEGLTEIPGSQY